MTTLRLALLTLLMLPAMGWCQWKGVVTSAEWVPLPDVIVGDAEGLGVLLGAGLTTYMSTPVAAAATLSGMAIGSQVNLTAKQKCWKMVVTFDDGDVSDYCIDVRRDDPTIEVGQRVVVKRNMASRIGFDVVRE
jgi:hypothetical protein